MLPFASNCFMKALSCEFEGVCILLLISDVHCCVSLRAISFISSAFMSVHAKKCIKEKGAFVYLEEFQQVYQQNK